MGRAIPSPALYYLLPLILLTGEVGAGPENERDYGYGPLYLGMPVREVRPALEQAKCKTIIKNAKKNSYTGLECSGVPAKLRHAILFHDRYRVYSLTFGVVDTEPAMKALNRALKRRLPGRKWAPWHSITVRNEGEFAHWPGCRYIEGCRRFSILTGRTTLDFMDRKYFKFTGQKRQRKEFPPSRGQRRRR